jgi:hypothetical protein
MRFGIFCELPSLQPLKRDSEVTLYRNALGPALTNQQYYDILLNGNDAG